MGTRLTQRCRWYSPKALKCAPTATNSAHTRGWLCRERPTPPHAELHRGSYLRRVAGRLWPSLGADCAAARSAAMAAARLRWRRRPAAMIAAACALGLAASVTSAPRRRSSGSQRARRAASAQTRGSRTAGTPAAASRCTYLGTSAAAGARSARGRTVRESALASRG